MNNSLPPKADQVRRVARCEEYDGKNQIRNAEAFATFTVSYMKRTALVDSTRSMKQAVIDRDKLNY
ncbi:hypothetical protein ACG4ZL_04115 [Serratia nematodiphila]